MFIIELILNEVQSAFAHVSQVMSQSLGKSCLSTGAAAPGLPLPSPNLATPGSAPQRRGAPSRSGRPKDGEDGGVGTRSRAVGSERTSSLPPEDKGGGSSRRTTRRMALPSTGNIFPCV